MDRFLVLIYLEDGGFFFPAFGLKVLFRALLNHSGSIQGIDTRQWCRQRKFNELFNYQKSKTVRCKKTMWYPKLRDSPQGRADLQGRFLPKTGVPFHWRRCDCACPALRCWGVTSEGSLFGKRTSLTCLAKSLNRQTTRKASPGEDPISSCYNVTSNVHLPIKKKVTTHIKKQDIMTHAQATKPVRGPRWIVYFSFLLFLKWHLPVRMLETNECMLWYTLEGK